MPLTIEEIAGCRESFDGFDKDGGGTIDIMELKNILNGLGAQPTDDELNLMIIQVDEDGSREINFAVFLKIIEKHKSLPGYMDKEEMDSLEAFAALGGGHDGTGSIPIDKVRALVQEFELDIQDLNLPIQADEEGMIDFSHFKQMLMA